MSNRCDNCGERAVEVCEECGYCRENCCGCQDGPTEEQIHDMMDAPSAAERQADNLRVYLDLK